MANVSKYTSPIEYLGLGCWKKTKIFRLNGGVKHGDESHGRIRKDHHLIGVIKTPVTHSFSAIYRSHTTPFIAYY